MISINEIKDWYNQLSEENKLQYFLEWHILKQELCSQILGIPTGTDDWIKRAINRADQLNECEYQLRSIIHIESELLEKAKWRTYFKECTNRMGSGIVGKESEKQPCSICKGTGRRQI